MTRLLYDLLLMSVSATLMFLLAALMYRQTKRRCARWYYVLLTAAVILLIVPVQSLFKLPKAVSVSVPADIAVYTDGGTAAGTAAGINISYIISALWAAVAAAIIIQNAVAYIKTRRVLKKASREVYDVRTLFAYANVCKKMKLRGHVQVRRSGSIRSPLLFGVIKPMIILPDVLFSESELEMIFTHELTHYRHKDLIIKLAASLAAALHWFNPFAHILKRSINDACELCCDETVLSILDLPDKKDYGRLLLSVIESGSTEYAYTTAMSGKKSIQRRLKRIVNFRRMSPAVKTVGVITALSMLICSVTAFGFDAATEALPDTVSEILDVSDAYFGRNSETDEAEEPEKIPEETPETEEVFEEELPDEIVYDDFEEAEEHEAAEEYMTETPVTSTEEMPVIHNSYDYNAAENVQYVDTVQCVRVPNASYMFKPVFTGADGEEIRSSIINITEDCTLRVTARGTDDLDYSLCSADGTLLLTRTQMGGAIPLKAGTSYYIAARCGDKGEAYIYIYAN